LLTENLSLSENLEGNLSLLENLSLNVSINAGI